MSKLRDLIEHGPTLCGVANPERWSAIFLHAFDSELASKSSVFAQKPSEAIEDRMEILGGLYLAKGAEHKNVAYWINLITLCAYSYAVAQGKTELADTRDRLAAFLSVQESSNVGVASIMSVSDASALTVWA